MQDVQDCEWNKCLCVYSRKYNTYGLNLAHAYTHSLSTASHLIKLIHTNTHTHACKKSPFTGMILHFQEQAVTRMSCFLPRELPCAICNILYPRLVCYEEDNNNHKTPENAKKQINTAFNSQHTSPHSDWRVLSVQLASDCYRLQERRAVIGPYRETKVWSFIIIQSTLTPALLIKTTSPCF